MSSNKRSHYALSHECPIWFIFLVNFINYYMEHQLLAFSSVPALLCLNLIKIWGMFVNFGENKIQIS